MMKASQLLTGLLSIAALLLLTATVSAQDVGRRRPEQVPATGLEDAALPTPTDVEGLRTLDAITDRSTDGLTFEQRADGTIALDLQGRFMHVITAAPGRDGHLDISCHTGVDAKAASAAAVQPWRPVKGDAMQRLNVSGLRAPIVVITDTPVALEEK
jgi:hypothetical protein